MQRGVFDSTRVFFKGFSTLYGSKWVATKVSERIAPKLKKFQYPLRVEVGCNVGTTF